jgi:Trp operon repressor
MFHILVEDTKFLPVEGNLVYASPMTIPPKHYRELFALFAMIKTPEEARKLLTDMLTPQEMDSLVERWQLIQLLAQGMPQRDIADKLGISISKVTRGSRVLQYGGGGFTAFLKKLQKVSH